MPLTSDLHTSLLRLLDNEHGYVMKLHGLSFADARRMCIENVEDLFLLLSIPLAVRNSTNLQ
jgi:hypothetical protein